MKALSLLQPYPWAIFDEVADKNLENRFWPPPIEMIEQRIALHASKGFDDTALPMIWGFGLKTPDMYTKSAIVGVATIDRVVTEARTLTPGQARWYMGPIRDGKTVHGWILKDRQRLPRPIPWDGALGLWTVPPLIEGEILAQLDGSLRTPPYLVPYAATLAKAGVENATEWAAKNPGAHLWFEYDGVASCVCCGGCKPRDTAKKTKPCRGVVRISLRSA